MIGLVKISTRSVGIELGGDSIAALKCAQTLMRRTVQLQALLPFS